MSIPAAAMEITFGWCGGEISDQLEADEEEKRREGGRDLLLHRLWSLLLGVTSESMGSSGKPLIIPYMASNN
ncbi:hypothetical protein F2Q70_00038945 [Brassica cretica]|uniref:Uncharacterized protein n=1 Tax=Brassica cretica TaxID=69181 RepID=A0A8S9KBG5_BRACR|nr:hypothetical protein F2Q70_00038945 [Brassica cretica]